jgi:hypothetical protein
MGAQSVLRYSSLWLDFSRVPKNKPIPIQSSLCTHLIINPKTLLGCTRKLLCGFQKYCKETKWPEVKKKASSSVTSE